MLCNKQHQTHWQTTTLISLIVRGSAGVALLQATGRFRSAPHVFVMAPRLKRILWESSIPEISQECKAESGRERQDKIKQETKTKKNKQKFKANRYLDFYCK